MSAPDVVSMNCILALLTRISLLLVLWRTMDFISVSAEVGTFILEIGGVSLQMQKGYLQKLTYEVN